MASVTTTTTVTVQDGSDVKTTTTTATVPVPRVVIVTPAGAAVIAPDANIRPVGVPNQFGFTEGPTWVPARGSWIFSDIPTNEQFEFTPATGVVQSFRSPSEFSNGNFLDNDGHLLSCEHKARSLTRTNLATGERTVLASAYKGTPLTSPNDVIVSRKTGIIYFTDPAYGCVAAIGHGEEKLQETNNVYRLDPSTGSITVIESTGTQPNGLCFSPDESQLYIADSGAYNPPASMEYDASKPHHVRVFDVVDGGKALANGRVFCRTADGQAHGVPDGIRVDTRGNLWAAVAEGVHVFSPVGVLIAKIVTTPGAANCAFGGPDGNDLLMTAHKSVWLIATMATGSGDIGPK